MSCNCFGGAFMTIFALRTKSLMEEKKISQKDLSALSRVSEASLCRYLKGENMPRMDVIINVAKALGVSQNYLLGGEDKNNQETPYVETRTVVMRNRGQLTDVEKAELIKILFGDSK